MKEEKTKTNTFAKSVILNAKRYEKDVDIVNALLKTDRSYTLAEVDKIIEDFKKGKVK